MRGDGDLYDYCVDDPIGRVDRDGRFFFALPSIAQALVGITGSLVGGVGVPWLTGKAIDIVNDNKNTPSGADAVKKVAPLVTTSSVLGKGVGAAIPITTTPSGLATLGEFGYGVVDPNLSAAPRATHVGTIGKWFGEHVYETGIKPVIKQKNKSVVTLEEPPEAVSKNTVNPFLNKENNKNPPQQKNEEGISYLRSPSKNFDMWSQNTILSGNNGKKKKKKETNFYKTILNNTEGEDRGYLLR